MNNSYKIRAHVLLGAFLAFAIAFLFSCKKPVETKFEKGDISLTCPKGWTITDEQDIKEGGGYYLSLERDGFGSSGLVTISWVNKELDLSEYLNIYRESLSDNIIYEHSDLEFGEQYAHEYNSISGRAMDFTASILGMKHEGTIYVFYGADKTIAILRQEASDDKEKNRKGFELIEKSFTLK